MTSQLIRFQGTWVAQVRYVIEVIGGIAGAVYEAVPMVKYNGVTYIADKGVQPTLGSNPATDTAAWSVFNDSTQNLMADAAVATTANITLSGEQTIDGVLTSTSRVLVKNQTLSQNNGVYVSAAGAWTRATDANTWDELVDSAIFISGGNTNAGKTFSCTVSSGGTLGTTPVTYQQSGSSLVYTATSPITKTGNDFGLAMNLIKNVAAVAPTVTDDETDGYMIGSSWKDSVTGYTYTCIDPTEGAAVWSQDTVAP